MRPPVKEIDINAMATKVDIDNRISLNFYYRIADNLLRQASVYREEKNLIDLYIMLLRFVSLVYETIPSHRDYHSLHPKEKGIYKKKALDVLNELESLKSSFNRQMKVQLDQSTNNKPIPQYPKKEQQGTRVASPTTLNQSNIGRLFLKSSFNVPRPKEETLSRHSILGPNGLQGQANRSVTGIRVQYPSNADLSRIEMPSLNQASQIGVQAEKHDSKGHISEMESVLSLDDGRWSPDSIDPTSEAFLQLNIRQPSPPPVLAHAQPLQGFTPIPPSQVADPRPGPAKISDDGMPNSKTFQHLHIPVKMMESFLSLAQPNTAKNLETCGVLAGSLKNRIFCVTTLIIPKQEATSDSCQTTSEEEIFDFQDKLSLFPLGWIHTHPSQTCFMSSIDLHTHYSYQIMLPEAIAIVMAPTDETRTHGIFQLSDPGGISVIRNCEQRGFHPHEEPSDGSSLYEHCSHVYMNPNLRFEVADMR